MGYTEMTKYMEDEELPSNKIILTMKEYWTIQSLCLWSLKQQIGKQCRNQRYSGRMSTKMIYELNILFEEDHLKYQDTRYLDNA